MYQININKLNNVCLQTPSNDSKIPHLFYINKAKSIHINFVFQKTIGQTFIPKVINIS
jgi:hypothetical protein